MGGSGGPGGASAAGGGGGGGSGIAGVGGQQLPGGGTDASRSQTEVLSAFFSSLMSRGPTGAAKNPTS